MILSKLNLRINNMKIVFVLLLMALGVSSSSNIISLDFENSTDLYNTAMKANDLCSFLEGKTANPKFESLSQNINLNLDLKQICHQILRPVVDKVITSTSSDPVHVVNNTDPKGTPATSGDNGDTINKAVNADSINKIGEATSGATGDSTHTTTTESAIQTDDNRIQSNGRVDPDEYTDPKGTPATSGDNGDTINKAVNADSINKIGETTSGATTTTTATSGDSDDSNEKTTDATIENSNYQTDANTALDHKTSVATTQSTKQPGHSTVVKGLITSPSTLATTIAESTSQNRIVGPGPTAEKSTSFSAGEIVCVVLFSFLAGVLVAVAVKMFYKRYKARTYELPPEQNAEP